MNACLTWRICTKSVWSVGWYSDTLDILQADSWLRAAKGWKLVHACRDRHTETETDGECVCPGGCLLLTCLYALEELVLTLAGVILGDALCSPLRGSCNLPAYLGCYRSKICPCNWLIPIHGADTQESSGPLISSIDSWCLPPEILIHRSGRGLRICTYENLPPNAVEAQSYIRTLSRQHTVHLDLPGRHSLACALLPPVERRVGV